MKLAGLAMLALLVTSYAAPVRAQENSEWIPYTVGGKTGGQMVRDRARNPGASRPAPDRAGGQQHRAPASPDRSAKPTPRPPNQSEGARGQAERPEAKPLSSAELLRRARAETDRLLKVEAQQAAAKARGQAKLKSSASPHLPTMQSPPPLAQPIPNPASERVGLEAALANPELYLAGGKNPLVRVIRRETVEGVMLTYVE